MSANKQNMQSVPRWYRGDQVPGHVIQSFVRQVVERFQPEKIILFGSHG